MIAIASILQGTKLLVVDDDPHLLNLVRAQLSIHDIDVEMVKGADEAINKLESGFIPDLILCDIMMPRTDGYAFHQRVRRTPAWRTIPFIYITALGDYPDYRKGMNLGADGYLAKPFTESQLVQELEHVIARQNEVRDLSAVTISVLGGQSVRRGQELLSAPDRGAEQLVFYLLTSHRSERERPISRQQAVQDVWTEMTASGFRSVLSRAKRWSEDWAQWHVSRDNITFKLEPQVNCDLYILESMLEAGIGGRRLAEAYHGPLLPDYTEEWAVRRRESLMNQVRERLMQDVSESSDSSSKLTALRRVIKVDPMELEAWDTLVSTLTEAGMSDEAQQAKQQLKRLLTS